MRLVKTTGGHAGAPAKCDKCGSEHFGKSGLAWHCLDCQTYYPTSLGFETIKKHFQQADRLMKEFKLAVNDLERIVKE